MTLEVNKSELKLIYDGLVMLEHKDALQGYIADDIWDLREKIWNKKEEYRKKESQQD